jgi:hypothetical protein
MELDLLTGGSLVVGSVGTSLGIQRFMLTYLERRVKDLEQKDEKHEAVVLNIEKEILQLRLLNEKNHELQLAENKILTQNIKDLVEIIKNIKRPP